jgi:hypothetical protein
MNFNQASMKTANPNEVRFCCPSSRCNDTGFHLYYNLKKKVYHCFKCGMRGYGEPDKEYSEETMEEMIQAMSPEKSVIEVEHSVILPESHPVRPGTRAMKYMNKRGIPDYKVVDMSCMWSLADGFDWRIIIPVFNQDGEPIFYQARALLKSIKPKYLNPLSPKGEALWYNMSSKPQPSPHLFVVEGIFKALQLWKIDAPAVAIFGKEMTLPQIKHLKRLTRRVTVMLDPDAYSFAIKLVDTLRVHGLYVNAIFPSKAPDDMDTTDLANLIKKERVYEILQ